MQYNSIPDSDLKVSQIGLGTMTFGQQNTESQAFDQLDMAQDLGVNLIDTAELYSIPPKASTYGATEHIIGHWLTTRKCRDHVIIATKIAGPGLSYIRGGSRFNQAHLEQAIEGSLKRLNTDRIDLYQLHWPERTCNFFGQLGFTVGQEPPWVPLEETLEALSRCVAKGKIRYIGVSNETPWGLMQFLKLHEIKKWPKMITIQNPYNLLNRSYEIGLSEISHREGVSLLAYSPLGFGVLSGKYLNGQRPQHARLSLFSQYQRYSHPIAEKATQAYVDLAKRYQLSPAQMALAYVNSRPFVGSTIIGATTLEQLKENICSIEVNLEEAVIQEIEAIHSQSPNPCP